MSPSAALRPHLPAIAARAEALDDTASFPHEDVALLTALGLPSAPLPAALGGAGAGTDPAAIAEIADLLRMLGAANPSVARLFEAHVNVVRLVVHYATPDQVSALAADCEAGHFHGLWVTDLPNRPLRLDRTGAMIGSKGPCSGAGHLRRALVTLTDAHDDTRMALLALTGHESFDPLGPRLHGMRAACNGTIALDGLVPTPIGRPGDYVREPDFSTGAWRTTAVTLGILDSLVEAVRRQLVARGHDGAPLQQARFGQMLVAQETARLWTTQAATVAEHATAPPADQVAYVNLARIAVESACLDAMRCAQRALGLGAMLRPNPVERILRDLATILRQPAPDAVLTEAAQHGLRTAV